ncbi:hypothetical protein [Alteromonas sp. CYL-A6]|uniref:hypothetical protein n=1 Tax=Alteromonas nitratireducens TaxID=3390813 RepID=UPI0034B0E90C
MPSTGQSAPYDQSNRRRLQSRRRHTRFTVLKRIIHLLVITGALSIAVALYGLITEYHSQWSRLHLTQPGTALSFQYAALLRDATSNGDVKAIDALLDVVNQDPFVISATVYNARGEQLATAGDKADLVSPAMLAASPVTFLRNISNDQGELAGYLQLLMDRELTLAQPDALRQQLVKLVTGIILLAVLVAIYLTRGIYKSKYWYLRHLRKLRAEMASK